MRCAKDEGKLLGAPGRQRGQAAASDQVYSESHARHRLQVDRLGAPLPGSKREAAINPREDSRRRRRRDEGDAAPRNDTAG